MESAVSYAKEAISLQKKIIFNAGMESALDYADPTTICVPKISLLFSPFGLPFVPIELLGSNVGSIIKEMNWQKDRANPGGMLVMEIAPDLETVKDIFNIIGSIPGGNYYTMIWKELGYDFEDLFKAQTLCQLWINGYHVMTGTVRSCICNSSVSNESYDVSYTLSIDELGNIYNRNTLTFETKVLTDLDAGILDNMNKMLNNVSTLKGTTVQVGIKAMLKGFIASTLIDQGMKVSDGFPLAFRLLAEANPIGAIANTGFAQALYCNANMLELNSQSFWGFMKNFIPTPWMEFYTESGGRTIVTESVGTPAVLFPGFNYIVARSLPYSNPLIGTVAPEHFAAIAPWDLTAIQMLLGGDFVIITDDDIMNKSIGTDGSAQATAFRVKYMAGAGTQATGISDKPILSFGALNPLASGGMGTFGMIEMEEMINCTSFFDAGTVLDSGIMNILQSKFSGAGVLSKGALGSLLAVWFRNQSKMREGSVTVKMKPWARPGMYCLYLPTLSGMKPKNPRDIGIYYIDSLSHNYSLEDKNVSASTTLNLIRGVPLPTSLAKTALLLFDYEILPPMTGTYDGEAKTIQTIKQSISKI